MRISDKLFKVIKDKNIKVHDLARESKVHHSAIYRILKEENKNPGIYTVKKLADALGISVENLI
nr:helix-turn-helix transcriptional regulator [uncultured Romboutsia sp.]